MRATRFGISGAVVAVLVATVLAGPASAETTGLPAAVSAPAAEGSAAADAVQAAPAEEAQAAPAEEVAEAPQPSSVPASVDVPAPAEKAPQPASSPSGAPAANSAPAPSQSAPAASLSDEAAPTAPVEIRTAAAPQPTAVVASVAKRTSELVDGGGRNLTEATASVTEEATQAMQAPRLQAPLEAAAGALRSAPADELLSQVASPVDQLLSQAASPVGAALDLLPLTRPAIDALPTSASTPPSAPAPLAFDSPASSVVWTGNVSGPELGDPAAGAGALALEGGALKQLTAFGGAESLRAERPQGLARRAGSSLPTMPAAVDPYRGPVVGGLPNGSVPEVPAAPLFRAPAAASASGGSSFVPVAALLALLALAAPATLRRLGRALSFTAPIPFVCALERPG